MKLPTATALTGAFAAVCGLLYAVEPAGHSNGDQERDASIGRAQGPLRVHPENPRYFTDGSGKAIYLTGSHTWNNFQHNAVYPAVNFDDYLKFLQRYNHNYIRLWVWEQGGWDPWAKGYVTVGPVAYARTGPGEALDGKLKYDLTRFNDEYFTRLRSRVRAAGERGIYVSVMLYEGWSVETKGQAGNPWRGHPFNKANNINGIDGDLNGDGQGPEIHTMKAPGAILHFQQAYVRRVIDTLNDLDNVLYEIGNEIHASSVHVAIIVPNANVNGSPLSIYTSSNTTWSLVSFC